VRGLRDRYGSIIVVITLLGLCVLGAPMSRAEEPAPSPSLQVSDAGAATTSASDPRSESGAAPEPAPAPEATSPPAPEPEEPYDPFASQEDTIEEYDPWEPFNVQMLNFNRNLDRYVLKPVAKVYDKVMPDPVEHGFRNAFRNIRFVPRVFNNVFQGKFKNAGIEVFRFVLNSTVGLGGFVDVAKKVYDVDVPDVDFGQTLGKYGVRPGPYLVVPIFGSFTVRDGVGYITDIALDPFNWLVLPFVQLDEAPVLVTNEDTSTLANLGARTGYIVNERSLNIETTFEGVEEATVDLYGAVRNAYLQKRAKLLRE
jgi:phospholipid-binding lipoprotein MlaA